jgi:hypothetical protein
MKRPRGRFMSGMRASSGFCAESRAFRRGVAKTQTAPDRGCCKPWAVMRRRHTVTPGPTLGAGQRWATSGDDLAGHYTFRAKCPAYGKQVMPFLAQSTVVCDSFHGLGDPVSCAAGRRAFDAGLPRSQTLVAWPASLPLSTRSPRLRRNRSATPPMATAQGPASRGLRAPRCRCRQGSNRYSSAFSNWVSQPERENVIRNSPQVKQLLA